MSPTIFELQESANSEDRAVFFSQFEEIKKRLLNRINDAINILYYSVNSEDFSQARQMFMVEMQANYVRGLEILKTTDDRSFVMAQLCLPVKADMDYSMHHFIEEDHEYKDDEYRYFIERFSDPNGNPLGVRNSRGKMPHGEEGDFIRVPVLIDYSKNEKLEKFAQYLIRTDDYVYYEGTAKDIYNSGVSVLEGA